MTPVNVSLDLDALDKQMRALFGDRAVEDAIAGVMEQTMAFNGQYWVPQSYASGHAAGKARAGQAWYDEHGQCDQPPAEGIDISTDGGKTWDSVPGIKQPVVVRTIRFTWGAKG